MEIKIIRKIDELGRVVIPKDVSKTLNLYPGDDVEIPPEEYLLRFEEVLSHNPGVILDIFEN